MLISVHPVRSKSSSVVTAPSVQTSNGANLRLNIFCLFSCLSWSKKCLCFLYYSAKYSLRSTSAFSWPIFSVSVRVLKSLCQSAQPALPVLLYLEPVEGSNAEGISVICPEQTCPESYRKSRRNPRLKKTVFSQLHKWGIANDPVGEGRSLRRKLAFRAELAENTKAG